MLVIFAIYSPIHPAQTQRVQLDPFLNVRVVYPNQYPVGTILKIPSKNPLCNPSSMRQPNLRAHLQSTCKVHPQCPCNKHTRFCGDHCEEVPTLYPRGTRRTREDHISKATPMYAHQYPPGAVRTHPTCSVSKAPDNGHNPKRQRAVRSFPQNTHRWARGRTCGVPAWALLQNTLALTCRVFRDVLFHNSPIGSTRRVPFLVFFIKYLSCTRRVQPG